MNIKERIGIALLVIISLLVYYIYGNVIAIVSAILLIIGYYIGRSDFF